LKPTLYGGGQENGLRSGTENVAGVIGFAAAFTDAKEHINGNRKKYTELVHLLQEKLSHNSIIPQFLGNVKHKLNNFCSISYPGLDAERIIFKLEEEGIYVSTGAACAASKGQKSQTLTAIGLDDETINGSLRITLGADITKEDIETFADTLIKIVNAEAERISLKGDK
jgi:cysteine desulfurase